MTLNDPKELSRSRTKRETPLRRAKMTPPLKEKKHSFPYRGAWASY
jgi:hypothetical protein